jgi:LacI family transcriptional regulator
MNQKTTPKQDRVTIKTVAVDAGVSVAAVSKVLRNAYGVSDALRANVQRSIDKLAYRPNVAARGMRGRTFTIGVLMTELRNPFLPEIVDGVNQVLEPSHYKAMLGVGQCDMPLEASLIESMIDYRMDGLVLIAPRLPPDVLARFAAEIPIVLVAYHHPTATGYDTVNTDDHLGARMAVEAMVRRGFRDIMMLTLEQPGNDETGVILPREQGYTQAMADAGLGHQARIMTTRDDARKLSLIEEMLLDPDRPEAIFCWSDLDAVHVLSTAARLGIRVPDDISVVGYDDSAVAAMPLVDLASISQSGLDLGAIAARTLMERMEGRTDPVHTVLVPSFIERRSIGMPQPLATAQTVDPQRTDLIAGPARWRTVS